MELVSDCFGEDSTACRGLDGWRRKVALTCCTVTLLLLLLL